MKSRLAAALLIVAFAATPALAEEGMWTLDNFPIARANAALGTRIDPAFLDRVRAASVNLGGCSAGLVSDEGLILTNNHCVATCVQNLSTPERQYAQTGFTPASRAEERQCPGATAQVLETVTDVTPRMQAAGSGLSGRAFTQARDAEAGRIETEACGDSATRRCQVVTLYRGGQFKLYQYRRYTDVRLAFAPEERAASFGGDLDNFSFPRFGIDAAFLRLYENGRPVATPNHFRWNAAAPVAGQPIFVAGNPGATQRLLTQDQLATIRDVVLPLDQLTASELRGRLIAFSAISDQNRFIAQDALAGVENTYKRGLGRMAALIDPEFVAARQAAEDDFRQRRDALPSLADVDRPDPFTALGDIQEPYRRLYPAYSFLEERAGGGSLLFGWARTLVRGAQERALPTEQRLAEFGDARLPAVRTRLLAATPVYPDLETLRLEWWLSKTREVLTVDDPRVRGILGDQSPEALARALATSRLGDPAVRQALWEGGLPAIQASDDPMIRFLLAIQDETRGARAEWEERVQGPTDRAAADLAADRFAVYGDAVYPDATGTLRLTYGRVEGWTYAGQTVPATTTFAGLWERATGADPFQVPPRLLAARERIAPTTVLDMAASTDTIGGSSGSPAINERGEIVGANFDSTVLSQRNAYGYDRRVNRSVIVTTGAITAALREAYGMGRLVDELQAGRR